MIPPDFVDVSALGKGVVYLLLWKGEVVYVGQSIKGYSRIATHYAGRAKRRLTLAGRTVRGVVFDQVCVKPVQLSDLDRVERELIERYAPQYNVRYKPTPVMNLEMLIDMMPAPMLPPNPEPRWPSWRRV